MGSGMRRGLAAAVTIAAVAGSVVTGVPAAAATGDEVLTWGRNQYGQLGNGATNAAGEPILGPVALPAGTSVTAVSGGYGFSIALTTDGEVLAWGQNDVGQLGEDSFTNSTEPVEVDLPDGVSIEAIAVGDDHILALTADGAVLAWGYNEWGQLGNGTNDESGVPVEVQLPAGTTVTAIEAGAGHSLALTAEGTVFAWGDNDFGQVGDGTTTERTTPVEIPLPDDATATMIAGGDDHSLALTSSGELLAWGYNGGGQIGDGTTTTRTSPVSVHLPADTEVAAIAGASGFQSFAITANGELLAWGDNSYGQIGDGTNTRRTEPVSVHMPDGTEVTAVDSGDDHAIALTSDGAVYGWGYNRYGQVGDGTTTNRNEPVQVVQPEAYAFVAIGVGSYHSLAIAQSPQTATTLTADPLEAELGDEVTLTAEVACTTGTPTGTVAFFVDGEEFGTAALEEGVAVLVTDALTEGEREIVAHYEGDGLCPPSDSEPVTVTVTYTECDFPPYEDGGEDVDGDGDGDDLPSDDGTDGDGDGDTDDPPSDGDGTDPPSGSDGDGDGAPGTDGGSLTASDFNGGDPPFPGGEAEQPGPCQGLPETGNNTSVAAAAGLAVAALGTLLLMAARLMRKLAGKR
ncbi:RCC1 domain-containing protein [Glycomyces niveus]|uniref:Ig-like domain repeat protein n=1 Tax=Glycomyces niveus TaxID=2820287 RepID=A0ABS3UA98_9ACTN|nr:Ig-like domain repeat protein [Glycomyces sp. NEAU-S30]MBO3735699.1 Ig-like domain repeat protein [Glycomyces sp. NEAU-S30]